jgi:hypothetical protein
MELIDMRYEFITTKEERDAIRRGEEQGEFEVVQTNKDSWIDAQLLKHEVRLSGMKMSDEGIEILLIEASERLRGE